jgi:hypothetical protein
MGQPANGQNLDGFPGFARRFAWLIPVKLDPAVDNVQLGPVLRVAQRHELSPGVVANADDEVRGRHLARKVEAIDFPELNAPVHREAPTPNASSVSEAAKVRGEPRHIRGNVREVRVDVTEVAIVASSPEDDCLCEVEKLPQPGSSAAWSLRRCESER